MDISRRSFIRWVIGAGAAAACPFPVPASAKKNEEVAPELHSEEWKYCHRVRDGNELRVPTPDTRCDVAIVGGGPSGLAAADELKNADFVLLEKEAHPGGNAYSESWQGLQYSTGSAWNSASDPAFVELARRWNFDWKPIQGGDSAYFDGVWIRDFWKADAGHPAFERLPYGSAVKDSFRRFLKEIEPIDLERQKSKLDARPFSDFMKGHAAPLKAFWDTFGPSNWGADTERTSAYLGLQAAKTWFQEPRYSWEGGIGIASRRIYDSLPACSRERIKTRASVFRVQRKKRRVWVSYFDQGKPRTLEARAAVMATPKFITKHLVEGLPSDQLAAMRQMRYIPYPVYNLCFDRVVYNQGYDNWVVGARHFTDFIPADWVTHAEGGDLGRKQVITVYAPRPESERADFQEDAKAIEKAQAAVRELLGIFPGWLDHLSEVRIYRRGHPMPVSMPGVFTRLQPLAGRNLPPIFFAHSDSMGEVSDFSYAALNGISAARKASGVL